MWLGSLSDLRNPRQKSQPHVVRRPTALVVAQHWPHPLDDFIQKRRPLFYWHALGERDGEGFQPSPHAGGKRRGARNQRHVFHSESCAFQTCPVILRSRKIPGNERCGVRHSVFLERGAKGDGDGSDASMPTHLRRETPARLEGAPNTLHHRIGIAFHPVHGSVRESSVELGVEAEVVSVHHARIESTLLGG